MLTHSKLKQCLMFLAFAFFIFFSGKAPASVFAGTGDNVKGWAWNSAFGWISFNSTDCDSDCNGSPCVSEGVPIGCPPAGSNYSNYGVNIDPVSGVFSGYAWNNSVGWISFNRTDTGNPPLDDPGEGNGAISVVDMYTGAISGWAKILSMGNDGWIRFNHGQANAAYGDSLAGELKGWAWNGNDDGTGIGWISLNCENESTCGTSDYRVFAELNSPPTVSELTASNKSPELACGSDALVVKLSWKYEDDSLNDATAYRIQVSGNGDFFDTGKCTGYKTCDGCVNPNFCTINFGGENAICFNNEGYCHYTLNEAVFSNMDYGVDYSWSVTVWDDIGLSNTESGAIFRTYESEFPDPDNFTWFPREFSVEEDAIFISMTKAKYYTGATVNDCDEDHCAWLWRDPDSNITIGSPTASTTIMQFNTTAPTTVELRLSDNNGYSCASTTGAFNIKQKLPSWIETKR